MPLIENKENESFIVIYVSVKLNRKSLSIDTNAAP